MVMETISWPSHKVNTFRRFYEFYCNQALCDVSLIAQDGTTFKAHQLLLAINSSFFHWVFHRWRETNERVTEFKTDIESHVLDAILSLIYQGEVKISSVWPWKHKILEAATTLQFSGIVEFLQGTTDERTDCQTECMHRGTDFQTEHRDRGQEFQPEPRVSGLQLQTEPRNSGSEVQIEPTNSGQEVQIELRNTGNHFQIESRRSELQVGPRNQGTYFPVEPRNQVIRSLLEHPISNRNAEFLVSSQRNQRSNVFTSSGVPGVYSADQTNQQTANLQSSGVGALQFGSVGKSTSSGVQATHAIGSQTDFNIAHPQADRVLAYTAGYSESGNRFDNDKNDRQAKGKHSITTNTSLQNPVSHMTFYAPSTSKQDLPIIPRGHGGASTNLINVTSSEGLASQNIAFENVPGETKLYVTSLSICEDVNQGPRNNEDITKQEEFDIGATQTSSLGNACKTLELDVTNNLVDEKNITVESKFSQTAVKGGSHLKGLGSKVKKSQAKYKRVNKSKKYEDQVAVNIHTRSSEHKTSSQRKSRMNKLAKMEKPSKARASKEKHTDTSDCVPKTRRYTTRQATSESSFVGKKNVTNMKTRAKGGKQGVKTARIRSTGTVPINQVKIDHKALHVLSKRYPNDPKTQKQICFKTVCSRYRAVYRLKLLYSANKLCSSSEHQYKCCLCNKEFRRYSSWRLHSLAVHLHTQKKLHPGQGSKLTKTKVQKVKRSGGENLKCTECGSLYSLRKTLKFHLMQVHHMTPEQIRVNSELLVKCELKDCHFASIDFGELERHAKVEHPTVKYKCPHCPRPRMFHLLTMLDKHVKKVHGDKPMFTCNSCGQKFVKLVHLQEHERDDHGIQHSIKLFRCDVEGCEYETVRKVFLDKHKQLGHKEHKCSHCNTVVKTQDTLMAHIKTMHLNIRPYLCDICGMGFAKAPVLRLHVKTKHEQEKDFKCQYCPYGTNVHWYLANHVFHRHGIKADFDNRKELSCSYCNAKYLTKSYLQKHIRNVHDQTFKCTCDVCGKSYKSYSAMSTHRKVHLDVEQKCPYCDYSSKTGEHMKLHIRTQHMFKGMKPYLCPYCAYCSAMGGNVRKHVMHKHPGEEVKYNTNKEQIMYMQVTEAQMEKSHRDKSETESQH